MVRHRDERPPRTFHEVAQRYRAAAAAGADPAAARSVVLLFVVLIIVLGLGGYLFATFGSGSSAPPSASAMPEVPEEPPAPPPPPPDDVRAPPVPADESELAALLDRLARGFQDGSVAPELTSSPFLDLALLVREPAAAEFIARGADPGLAALPLLREPEAHRGKFFRLRGRVVQSKQFPFLPGTPGRPEWILLAFVEEETSAQTVALYFFPGEGTPKFHVETVPTSQGRMQFVTTWIEAEAVFLRTWQYATQWRVGGRPALRTAIVALAPRVREVAPPIEPEPDWALYGGGGAGIVLLVLVIAWIGVRRGRRVAAERIRMPPRVPKAPPP